jgi:hypothetical protein
MNQHILMLEGKKNVLVSPSTKTAEKFIKQISTLFKVKTFNEINHFPFLNIFEITYYEYLPSIFYCVDTLETFLQEIDNVSDKEIQLNNFTLTFLYPQHITQSSFTKLMLFENVYGIRKNKVCYVHPIKEIKFTPLIKHEMQKCFLQEKKKNIFKIIKNKYKVKKQLKIKYVQTTTDDFLTNPNSLIYITKEVKKYIFTKNKVTSLEITNYIVDLLKRKNYIYCSNNNNIKESKIKTLMSYKNIQRRVYDAVNIMVSLGILTKNGKKLYVNHSNNNTNCKDMITLPNKEQLKQNIDENKKMLLKQLQLLSKYIMLIKRNKEQQFVNNKKDFYFINLDNYEEYLPLLQRLNLNEHSDYQNTVKEIIGKEGCDYLKEKKMFPYENNDNISINLNRFESQENKLFDIDFDKYLLTNETNGDEEMNYSNKTLTEEDNEVLKFNNRTDAIYSPNINLSYMFD